MSAEEGAGPASTGESVVEGADEWAVRKGRLARFRSRLRGNPQLVVGLVLLGAFVAVGIASAIYFGDGLTTLSKNSALGALTPPPGPSRGHPFGVLGGLGVDEFRALVQATPIDLLLVGGTTVVAAALGVLLGSYAGLAGGAVDVVITEVSDLLVGVPPFFLVMVLFVGVEPFLRQESYLWVFSLLFVIVLFPYHARPVRARALEVAGEPYVEAARAAGASQERLLFRHVLPNSTAPALAQLPVDVYNILFVLTAFPFLSCLGGGANPLFALLSPLPSATLGFPEWGFLLAQGACNGWSPLATLNYPWMYGFPAAVVILFGIAVTLACDGFERYLGGRAVRG